MNLAAAIVEDLRSCVERKDPGPYDHFPIFLFQIISKVAPHNRTPLLETDEFPDEDGAMSSVPYVRIYLD